MKEGILLTMMQLKSWVQNEFKTLDLENIAHSRMDSFKQNNQTTKKIFIRTAMTHCACNTVLSRGLYSGGAAQKNCDSYGDVC